MEKQGEILEISTHLVEIDLLRTGQHVVTAPARKLEGLSPFQSLVCVSRGPTRNRFELYPRTLEECLPTIRVPLAEDDLDVALNVQAVFEKAYDAGSYRALIRYDEPCEPPLPPDLQVWADQLIRPSANQ